MPKKSELDGPMVTWEEIDAKLDWQKIKAAINHDPEPADEPESMFAAPSGQSEALKMVRRALTRYAPRDLYYASIEGLEYHFDFEGIGHGFVDLTFKIERPYKSFTAAHVGKIAVVDWKSTGSDLGQTWVDRQERSWQWKLYAAALKADLMIYRGISRTQSGGEREIIMELPPAEDLIQIVRHQFKGYHEMLQLHNSRTSEEFPAWNQHMPYACGAYAHKCPHVQDCVTNDSPFVIIPPEILSKPVSYSSGERLTLCAERHRRYLIAREGLIASRGVEDDLDETEETRTGSAMHRGLEEAYRQLKEMREKGQI